MKNTIFKLVLAVLLLAACGSTPVLADGGSAPVPLCWPNPARRDGAQHRLFFETHRFQEKGNPVKRRKRKMKKTIFKLVLAVLLLAACGSTPVLADGGGAPVPICWPNPCP